MKKRLIIVILLCIAGSAVSAYAFNDVKSAKDSLVYDNETLIGDMGAAQGLDLCVSTTFAPGDVWNSNLSVKDGKLIQSSFYEYDKALSFDQDAQRIVASLDFQLGAADLFDNSAPVDENSVGLKKAIYDSCLDMLDGSDKTVSIKLSDYFEYYPIKVSFYPNYRNYDDKDQSEFIEHLQRKFESAIKVPVSEDANINLMLHINKAADGKITVEYDSMDMGANAPVVFCSYDFVTDNYKGCIAIPFAGVYKFYIDLGSVQNSHIEKIFDVTPMSYLETYEFKDGRHTLIIARDENNDCRICLYDSAIEDFVSDTVIEYTPHKSVVQDHEVTYTVGTLDPFIYENDEVLAVGSPDFFLAFCKDVNGDYKLKTYLSDLQKTEDKAVWFSVFSNNWDYLVRPYHYYLQSSVNIRCRDEKLVFIKANICEEVSEKNDLSLQVDNKYYQKTPGIIAAVFSGNEVEYVGKFMPCINTSKASKKLISDGDIEIVSVVNDSTW